MSRRGRILEIKNKLGNKFAARQPMLQSWVGLMGDGEGNLYPDSDDPTYVFVRRRGRARVERVRNTRLKERNDLPVIVGFAPERPDEQQVLDYDDVALTTLGAYGYVKNHHQQHELFNPSGGDDTVWVYSQQFLYMLVQVTDPVSNVLQVRSGVYAYQGAYKLFAGATTVDLTTFAPAAGLAVMVLISINATTGNLVYESSLAFVDTLPKDMWYSQVPTTPDGSMPVAAVYVPNGATTFNWDYILDWRVFINVIGDVQVHDILSASHQDTLVDTIARGDLFVARLGASVQWQRYAHPGGAGYALTTDANDVVWDQTPNWTGKHTFSAGLTIPDGQKATFGTGEDGEIYSSSDDLYIKNVTQDKDVYINVNDGGVDTAVIFVQGSTGNVGVKNTNPIDTLHMVEDGSATATVMDSYGNTGAQNCQIIGRTASGSLAVPAATPVGRVLLAFSGRGHDGTGWTTTRAFFGCYAEENFTALAQGAYMRFSTTAPGGVTRTEKMRLTGDGRLALGTTTPGVSAALDITSTTGALLVPRMTTAQRNALTAVNGMIVYDTTVGAFYFYEAGAWVTGSGLV